MLSSVKRSLSDAIIIGSQTTETREVSAEEMPFKRHHQQVADNPAVIERNDPIKPAEIK